MSETADGKGRGADRGHGVDGAAPGRVAALEKVLEQYKVLLETSAAVAAGTGLGGTLDLIARLVTERLDVAGCDLYEYEAAGDEFVALAFSQLPESGADASDRVGARRAASAWIDLEACVGERRPSIWYHGDPDLSAGRPADAAGGGALSSLSLPLVYGREVLGLIEVRESRTVRRWTADDERVLQAIADHAAFAIAEARARARLEGQAVTDGLTGLFNHHHFDQHLRREVTTARRYGHELSLMMVDLDDFKEFNDRYGHAQGDRVLAELAEILRHATRNDVDILARYGGDELMVILPETRANGAEPSAARHVAERVAAVVRRHRFESAKGSRDVTMTVSIGVAGLGLGGYTHEDLLSSADKALYLAKHQGKDQVSVFGS